jgi:hypothetical protein
MRTCRSADWGGYEEISDVLADPSHRDRVEGPERVADVTGTDEPYDPGLLEVDAANRALSICYKAV